MRELNPHYLAGFIDGEGSINIWISKHKTTRRRKDVRAAFELETDKGFAKIVELREEMRKLGKKSGTCFDYNNETNNR